MIDCFDDIINFFISVVYTNSSCFIDTSGLVRYNVFGARLLINHAENGKKYLYDILTIKKETSKPQQ